MGDLPDEAYCEKVNHLVDLLKGLGEKVKDKDVINYSLNGLLSKFESVENILCHSKPLPMFSNMCSTLYVEETRLAAHTIPFLSHGHQSSSPSLLHVRTTLHHCRKIKIVGGDTTIIKGVITLIIGGHHLVRIIGFLTIAGSFIPYRMHKIISNGIPHSQGLSNSILIHMHHIFSEGTHPS